MKKIKFYLGFFLMTGWVALFFAAFVVNSILGNNYKDVYEPFWINISTLMLLASIAWGLLAVVLEEKIDDAFMSK